MEKLRSQSLDLSRLILNGSIRSLVFYSMPKDPQKSLEFSSRTASLRTRRFFFMVFSANLLAFPMQKDAWREVALNARKYGEYCTHGTQRSSPPLKCYFHIICVAYLDACCSHVRPKPYHTSLYTSHPWFYIIHTQHTSQLLESCKGESSWHDRRPLLVRQEHRGRFAVWWIQCKWRLR